MLPIPPDDAQIPTVLGIENLDSGHLHLNGFWLGFLCFWQTEGEQAIFNDSFKLRVVHQIGQRKVSHEIAVGSFHTMKFFGMAFNYFVSSLPTAGAARRPMGGRAGALTP